MRDPIRLRQEPGNQPLEAMIRLSCGAKPPGAATARHSDEARTGRPGQRGRFEVVTCQAASGPPHLGACALARLRFWAYARTGPCSKPRKGRVL